MKPSTFIKSLLVCTFFSYACVSQSPTDPRIFHCETLDNGLSFVLVQDPEATESAAAMRVGVGSQEDPEGLEGLAHFLEHMLFIGTDEYPEVNALSQYVSSHGGMNNAFTARDHTQYYFSVNPNAFENAFDIFSSFFISPMLSEEYVERERHAVHAEFKLHQKEDGWRQAYVASLTGNPEHPANRFNIGNLDTLSECQPGKLRQALETFYYAHYSSTNMHFVAVTPLSVDTLLPMIRERLSQVQSRAIKSKTYPHRLDESSLSKVIHFKTLTDTKDLEMEFLIPNPKLHYLSPAANYVAGLIGDEGKGSILANLKESGLAIELSAGVSEISDLDATFNIHIGLTNDGYEHIDKVIQSVVSYIDLVRKNGSDIQRFHEIQKVSYLHYLFYTHQSVVSQANSLVSNMAYLPNDLLIKGSYISDESIYDQDHIYSLLDALRLDNARVWISSPNEKTTERDTIFDAEYAINSMTFAQVINWLKPTDYKIDLPGINPYIPENINIENTGEVSIPKKISTGKIGLDYWLLKNHLFQQPKKMLSLKLIAKPHTSAEEAVMTSMITSLIYHNTIAELYPAAVAGLKWGLVQGSDGITFKVSGLGDNHGRVMNTLLSSLHALRNDIQPEIFNILKHDKLNFYKNLSYVPPAKFLSTQLPELLLPSGFSQENYINALAVLTIDQVKDYLNDNFSEVSARIFQYGNINSTDIDQLVDLSEFKLSDQYFQNNPARLVKLPTGNSTVEFSSKQKDHAVVAYYQFNEPSYKNLVLASIIAEILNPDFFEQLRTEEQLGYIVGCQNMSLKNWPAIGFVVQSPNKDTEYIASRIDSFFNDYQFTEATFHAVKSSIAHQLKSPFKNMAQENNFYWHKLDQYYLDFNSKELMLEALETIDYNDVKDALSSLFIQNSNVLTLMVNASEKADSFDMFKAQLGQSIVSVKMLNKE